MRLASLLIGALFFSFANAQPTEKTPFRILFYNVENLLDTINDPATQDDEYAQGGLRNWNAARLNQKIDRIAKVFIASGGWDTLDVIGLCEVENLELLERLVDHPLLRKANYGIIHKESPDHRGMDVALLYRKSTFQPQSYSCIALRDSLGEAIATREILQVAGCPFGGELIHIFVNHWPSRYGGLMETKISRNIAARALRAAVDSLLQNNAAARIVCMGDFNDRPHDESIYNVLGATAGADSYLVNLSAGWEGKVPGTIKHEHEWMVFDQFMVSRNIASNSSAKLIAEPFLLENDPKYAGKKPFRTYIGFRYNAGFSDHLPVLLRLTELNGEGKE